MNSAKTKSPRHRHRRRRSAFTLIELMIVVNILGILFAIAAPSIRKSRDSARTRACITNLRRIQGAKEQWALENRRGPSETPLTTDLYGPSLYIRTEPRCPSNGSTYLMNGVGFNPQCQFAPTVHVL